MLNQIIEPSTPFTDHDIARMEETLGRKLPEDYRAFVKEYGDAFFVGEIESPKKTSILAFSEANEYCGELSLFNTYDGLTEIGAGPFACCEFGNIYVLAIKNEVYYIDFIDGKTSSLKVATSFSDFLSRIVADEDEDEDMEDQ